MKQETHHRETWFAIGLVVIATLITYGIFIPQLGFYRDDWYMIWTGQGRGLSGLIALFQNDRPFIGYVYAVLYRLLGAAPLGWHLLALAVRLISGLAFLWFTRLLWPQHKIGTTLLALLYVVYPGFLQQSIAGTYINLLMAVAASVLSFALTAQAIQTQSRSKVIFLSLGALILLVFYLAIFESMVGLEAARFLIIIYLLIQTQHLDWKSVFKRAFLWGWPYLFASGAFLIWRLLIFKSSRHSTDVNALLAGYSISPLRAFATISIETIKDFFETVFLAWAVPLYQFTVNDNFIDLLLSLMLAGLIVSGILVYLHLYERNKESMPHFPAAILWLGGFMTFSALLPINIAGRSISFSQQWDRYTLHAAMGAVVLVGGLVFNILRSKARTWFLLSLLVSGVVTQFHSSIYYRDFWMYQRALWWQMSWRAPALKPGTLLYAQLPIGFGFFEDYEVYSPANLIYAPGPQIKLAADLFNSQTVPLLMKKEIKGITNRGIYVRKNYRNALMLFFPEADSCLHVIDGRTVEVPGFSQLDLLYISSFSNIERIEVSAPMAFPSTVIFGSSPKQGWCYYYQKISLARQQEDWASATLLADEASQKGFRPRDRSEWIPVFEAYANTGQLDKAAKIVPLMAEDRDMLLLFCSQIGSSDRLPPSYNYDYIFSALCQSP